MLECSADGKLFTSLAALPSMAPAGNSTARIDYSYDDVLPLNGDNFYRLVQTDRDGRQSISQTLQIHAAVSGNAGDITVYPNPAGSVLNLNINAGAAGAVSVAISDISGKVVVRSQFETRQGLNRVAVDVSRLEAGVYLLRTSGSSPEIRTIKFRKN